MRYADLLKKGIAKRGLSLNQIVFQLAKRDICLDKAILSKMQNGKHPPAKDDINIVLADVLQINSTEFRLAAVKEIIPESLYELIKTAS